MSGNWSTFNLPGMLPAEAVAITDGISGLLDTLTGILKITRTALEIASQYTDANADNPVEKGLTATIDELLGFVDGLAGGTTAHAILIPIQKQYYGKGNPYPAEDLRGQELSPSFDTLLADNAFYQQLLDDISPDTIAFINSSAYATGGNAGFWRALALSLVDNGDLARPLFPDNFAVAGVAVVFGAENLGELQPHFDVLNQLVPTGNRADLAAHTRPVAQDISAQAVPISDEGGIGVQVEWAGIPPIEIRPLFSGERLINLEIFVIRSTDPRFRQSFSWNQMFTRQPTADSTDLQVAGDTRVIARLRNDGLTSRYIDTDPTLRAETIYYYAIAIRYSLDGNVQPMGNFSSVIRIMYRARPLSSRKSEAPDWWATPSLIQLFPALGHLLNRIRLTISSLNSRTSSNSGIAIMVQQTIEQIDLLVSRGESVVTELTGITDKIKGLLEADLGGISAATITASAGGMQGWLGELGACLADQSDPARPAYDNGELVGGLVIVAGAPNLPKLQAFITLMSLFFGSTTDNPLIDALDTIDAALAPVTTVTLDTGLIATRAAPDTVSGVPKAPTVFDVTMAAKDTVDCG